MPRIPSPRRDDNVITLIENAEVYAPAPLGRQSVLVLGGLLTLVAMQGGYLLVQSILVVTHNPEIARAARRVIRLRDGCVEHDSEAG